jgi:lysozyme
MPPLNEMAQGIDVSKWQQQIDWAAVRAGGISFAYIKATQGLAHIDPLFGENWRNSQAAGVPRGAYLFFNANDDPRGQAQHLARTLQGIPGELPPALDVERNEGVPGPELVRRVEVCLDELEHLLKVRPILYTRASFYNESLRGPGGSLPNFHNTHPVWVAHYTTGPLPAVPRGYTTWHFWQYTETGAVPGVLGNVDRNRFNGTVADLEAYLAQAMGGARRPEPVAGTLPGITNQVMVNAFSQAFGAGYWDIVIRCGLTALAIPPDNRPLPYSGPPLEQIPSLSDAERAALFVALDLPLPARLGVTEYVTWEHHALPGLHGPADPGGGWVPEAYEVVRVCKARAVKMLAPDLQAPEVAELRSIRPDMFVMARLFSGQLGQPRGGGTPEGTARWFANEVADPGDPNNPMLRAYNSGVRYFEVHNEPNLVPEGLGVNWHDGEAFARFFNTVVDLLRPRFPEARFGFPGLSPGFTFADRPIEFWTFLAQAQPAIERADFLCTHTYWGGDGSDVQTAVGLLRAFCQRYPQRVVFCTEFSNNSPVASREAKMDEYAVFYQACQALPPNLGAVFAYALSWRDDHNREGFLDLGPDGRWLATGLAQRLGTHTF